MHSLLPIAPGLLLVAMPLVCSLPSHHSLIYHIDPSFGDRAQRSDVSQFHFEPFNITELHIFCVRPDPTTDYSCNTTFNWFDPNSVPENAVTRGSCLTSWTWDGVTKHNETIDGSDPVADFRTCWADAETFFKVAVPSFWRPGNFSLELAHRYRDDQNFSKPWDHPTTFAEVYIIFGEEEKLEGTMHHYRPGPINATVVGLID